LFPGKPLTLTWLIAQKKYGQGRLIIQVDNDEEGKFQFIGASSIAMTASNQLGFDVKAARFFDLLNGFLFSGATLTLTGVLALFGGTPVNLWKAIRDFVVNLIKKIRNWTKR
jgi:hypothetical protein